jgi:RNA polymerase sigma factor (sigma-70 family)
MAERLFAHIEQRFKEEHEVSRLGRRLQEWRSEHRPLARFEDVDSLIRYFRDPSVSYEPKDEIAGILCALSPEDELANLLLFKLYIPGLIAKRRALFGRGLTQDELDATLVAGFLDRAAKTSLGTDMLSGRLLSSAREWVEREIDKRVRPQRDHEVPAPVDELFAEMRDPTDIADQVVSKAAAIDVVRRALNQGAIAKDQAAVLWAADVEGLSRKDVAARIGIAEGAARVRLHRARARLRAWLEGDHDTDRSENL